MESILTAFHYFDDHGYHADDFYTHVTSYMWTHFKKHKILNKYEATAIMFVPQHLGPPLR